MARVVFSEDRSIAVEVSNPEIASAEILKAYFAVKKETDGDFEDDNSGDITHTVEDKQTLYSIGVKYKVSAETIKSLNQAKYPAIKNNTIRAGNVLIIKKGVARKTTTKTHTVVDKETVYSISKKYGLKDGELARLNSVKNNVIKKGQKLTISTGPSTAKLEFKKTNTASLGQELYLVVETKGMRNKKIELQVIQGGAKVVTEKDAAIKFLHNKKEVTKVIATVGAKADAKYANNESLKNLAVAKITLAPKSDDDQTAWKTSIEKVDGKTAKLYIGLDAHTENQLKAGAISYQGNKSANDNNTLNSYFLNADKKWLTLSTSCIGQYCIKKGDTGKIVEELNIRLAGFGGTVPEDKFTDRTEKAVKQFQRDYMKVEQTGKVCGKTLKAIDAFKKKYSMKFSSFKCPCNTKDCDDFGNGLYAKEYNDAKIKEKRRKYEYPGIHRNLGWVYRALRFYLEDKEKDMKFSIYSISSGYRCHAHNKLKSRTTTNHMGKAVDLKLSKNGKRTKVKSDVNKVRKDVFEKYMGAAYWTKTNALSLEPGSIAPTWIHYDVREFERKHLKKKFFVKSQAKMDGDLMIDLAKKEGYENICECKK